jgi:hypothetical protein
MQDGDSEKASLYAAHDTVTRVIVYQAMREHVPTARTGPPLTLLLMLLTSQDIFLQPVVREGLHCHQNTCLLLL